MPRVVVIGGGISGLAAAHRLAASGPDVEVVLLEASERLGGRITTVPFAGVQLDVGPDALLSRAPGGVELCRELGLEAELVAPAPGPAYLWSRGRLRPIPAGLLAGLPAGPGELLRSRILSPRGLARAGLDLVLPRGTAPDDETIGALVRRRMGDQVLDRLIDPLLGGINAGSCDELSARAAAPHLAAAAAADRSLVRGLRAGVPKATPGPTPAPMFLTLRGGLGCLVETLVARSDAEFRTSASVDAVVPDGGGLEVVLDGGEVLAADGVILAVPAHAAADILRGEAPAAAFELAGIRSASVAVVALAYPRERLDPPPGSGFVVARDEDLGITACTWASAKWPHLGDGPLAIVKCSIGRAADGSAEIDRTDEELIAVARRELARTLGVSAEPAQALVLRHAQALPQYEVGHLDRIAAARRAVEQVLPGLELAGNAYGGVGLPSCISGAHAAAERLLSRLGDPGARTADHQELIR